MKRPALFVAVLLLVAGCATSDAGWTSREGAQPFDTAHAACREISYGIETNFITCMAGRGWVKGAR